MEFWAPIYNWFLGQYPVASFFPRQKKTNKQKIRSQVIQAVTFLGMVSENVTFSKVVGDVTNPTFGDKKTGHGLNRQVPKIRR